MDKGREEVKVSHTLGGVGTYGCGLGEDVVNLRFEVGVDISAAKIFELEVENSQEIPKWKHGSRLPIQAREGAHDTSPRVRCGPCGENMGLCSTGAVFCCAMLMRGRSGLRCTVLQSNCTSPVVS